MLRFDRQEDTVNAEMLAKGTRKKPLIGAQPPNIAWRYARRDNRPSFLASHSLKPFGINAIRSSRPRIL